MIEKALPTKNKRTTIIINNVLRADVTPLKIASTIAFDNKIKSKFKASEIRAILFNLIPVKFACHLLNLSLQSYFIIYSNSYTIIICILCFNKTIC